MRGDDGAAPQGLLSTSVAAGPAGPLIVLSGEADLSTVTQFGALITAQLPAGTQELTIDVSGLRFADTASIRALVLAARTLKERGGSLVLLRPHHSVASMLALLGADQVFAIQGQARADPEPEGSAG